MESSGTGGRNKIQGRIFFPSGRRSDASSVKVTLESTSSEKLFVIADLNGTFSFTSLAPGNYSLSAVRVQSVNGGIANAITGPATTVPIRVRAP